MRVIVISVFASWMGLFGSASAEDYRWSGPIQASRPGSQAVPAPKESEIRRLRTVLNLTPEQVPYWSPVEAALLQLARQNERADGSQLRRLKGLAAPLVRSLDEVQKRDAISFARQMGYGRLVASF
jgi:hypothetical protein